MHQKQRGQAVGGFIDKHFMKQMIPHHEGSIDLTELARRESECPDILMLAVAITESQSEEITRMRP